jgi:DNA-binding transcriptional LysR family regulator
MALDRLVSMTVFRRAVELGSIVAAGRATGISAEMAGQHLKALEANLGVRLLSRTTRRLSPTEAGRAYYDRCVAALDEIALADAEAGARQAEPSGRVRLTAPLGFGNALLAPAITSFLERYPNVTVEIDLSERKADLLAGDYDLAVRLGELAPSSLMSRRLAIYPLILAASPAYLVSAGVPEHPQDLSRHEALIYAQTEVPTRWSFGPPDGKRVAVALHGRVVASDVEFLVRLALLGRGVLLAPSFMLDAHLKLGTLIEILPAWRERSLPLYLLWAHRTLIPAPTRAFIDFMVEWLSSPKVEST